MHGEYPMDREAADALLAHAEEEGFELFVWGGRIMWPRGSDVPPWLMSGVEADEHGVVEAVIRRNAAERAARSEEHQWLLRLGDKPWWRIRSPAPSMIVCGSPEWCRRMLRQAAECATTKREGNRWVTIGRDQVTGVRRGRGGRLVAEWVLPVRGGVGMRGGYTEVLSACGSCMARLSVSS